MKKKKFSKIHTNTRVLLLASALFFASCSTNETNNVSDKNRSTGTSDIFQPFNVNEVKVNGEIGRRIDITLHENIQKIDIDNDFIIPFIKKDNGEGFVGIGMYIDALAKIANYTGDQQIILYKDYIIDQLITAQLRDGYIGMLKPETRMWHLWDIHEMAYIIFGLTTDYQCFQNQESLNAAIKVADYILRHWSEIPQDWEEQTRVCLHEAVTGIDRSMLTLYQLTGERRFLDFCENKKELRNWDQPIVIGRRPGIEGHVYGYLGVCLAQLEMYRLFPQKKLLIPTERAIHFLTANDGMTISGEAGQWEIWTDDQDGNVALGETCATAYQIRVYESLLRLLGDSRYADIMERTIYNALFAAQSPDGRNIRYYTPLAGTREYFDKDTYCCPSNFRRIISELPSMIYYKTQDEGICISLYTASSAKTGLSDGTEVYLSQETDYPNSGKIVIAISPSQPKKFPLRLRVPTWAKGATVSINGKEQHNTAGSDRFISLDRIWTKGDTVLLNIPMEWRLIKGRKRQAGRVAVMRGPVIFCLNPSKNQGKGMEKLTSVELERLWLDPLSLKGPFADETVRPGGMVCKVGAWKEGFGMSDGPYDYELLLTEFPDPESKSTYFTIADLTYAQEDELNQIFE